MTSATVQASTPAAARVPSRLRFAGFVVLFVYPLVLSLQYLLMPLTGDWPLPLRTAAFVPLMVFAMVWGVIPFIQTRLRRFL
jgi:antibiotic biosynthesis monooxygenase (ABM) superfamily enzyme